MSKSSNKNDFHVGVTIICSVRSIFFCQRPFEYNSCRLYKIMNLKISVQVIVLWHFRLFLWLLALASPMGIDSYPRSSTYDPTLCFWPRQVVGDCTPKLVWRLEKKLPAPSFWPVWLWLLWPYRGIRNMIFFLPWKSTFQKEEKKKDSIDFKSCCGCLAVPRHMILLTFVEHFPLP